MARESSPVIARMLQNTIAFSPIITRVFGQFSLKRETGMGFAGLCVMSRRHTVIQFPADRTAVVREQKRAETIKTRVNALPDAIQELDVAWIFKMADKRRLNTRP